MLKSEIEVIFEGERILAQSKIAASKKREATNKRARIEPASNAELMTDFFVQGWQHFEIVPDASKGPLTFAADMMTLPYRTRIIPADTNPDKREDMMDGENYVVRLVPISGRVKQVRVNGSGTATESFCRVWQISSPGTWFVYIFFEASPTPLGPIEIPEDFEEYWEIKMHSGS